MNEDDHFAEVPGCPLRGVRAGATSQSTSEQACARCLYNVAFPGTAQIGCHLRTPADVVNKARAAAGAAIAQQFTTCREQQADLLAWQALGSQLLEVDDDNAREVAAVILRFAAAAEPVEILR